KLASPRSTGRVVASLGGVFLVTIALLVVAGVVYPQFELPQPPGAVAEEAAERGEELFRSSNVGCLTCHTVSGEGGIRGPDLTHVASQAGERVPGLAAEQYLLEKVGAGASYQYNVPEYVPMMPEFAKRLTEEQLQDVVAFLLSLE
ncbi:MAG: c-type cytochrome, partial [Dehalococcoidia bacterium]